MKTRLQVILDNTQPTSEAIGTVELTGLQMMHNIASGQTLEAASERDIAIPALMLNKSSRVIPGFLGKPAGIITILLPEMWGLRVRRLTRFLSSNKTSNIDLTTFERENRGVLLKVPGG